MKRRKTRRPRSARAKPARQRAAKSGRTRRRPITKRPHDFIEPLFTAGAQALGLSIDPAWRDGVKFHLRLVLDHAARVDEFPLPDDAEPAPVFHA